MNLDLQAVIGPGGVGKSHRITKLLEANPAYALKTSSSGISAVNINGTTVHSALKYFDTQSLLHAVVAGETTKQLAKIAKGYERLAIDEISMLSGQELDLIVTALMMLKQKFNVDLGLEVSGDLGQLSPVTGHSFIKSKYWPQFKVTQLTKIWRQDNVPFIQALMLVRAGRAGDAADYFESTIGFHKTLDEDFQGTTFLATNKEVNAYNAQALRKLQSVEYGYSKHLSKQAKSEWENIPKEVKLKIGSKVLILVNNLPGYANGDLAVVEEMFSDSVLVKLARNNTQHIINYHKVVNQELGSNKELGTLEYMPLRLADSSTIHKVQGLTLEKMQLKLTSPFLALLSGGLYTGLSRCRTPEGLRLVGTKDSFIRACCVNKDFLPYLALPEAYVAATAA